MNLKIVHIVVASVCLAALASADTCLGGLKGLFCKKSDYEKLANYLYENEPSSELEQNARAAKSLYLGNLGDVRESYMDLVSAFAYLLDGNRDELCSWRNLRMLHVVAESMREGGNLGPKKISEPIRRLNEIVFRLIAKAHSKCFVALDNLWLTSRARSSVFLEMSPYVAHLTRLPPTYLFEGYTDEKPLEGEQFVKILTDVVALNQASGLEKFERSDYNLGRTDDQLWDSLTGYLLLPCMRFYLSHEAATILRPYSDLLISEMIAKSMDKFQFECGIDSPFEHPPALLEEVHRYMACSRLSQISWPQLAKMVKRNAKKSFT